MLLLHGLGATKASFLPTIAALAGSFRVTAIDLPGFGDSAMPVGAAYDAPFFARAVAGVLDALEHRARAPGRQQHGRPRRARARLRVPRAHRPARAARPLAGVAARAPLGAAAARRAPRARAAPARAARSIVDRIARAMVPGGHDGWSAVGVDEFLRGYLTPRGRAAFYAAARNIYLEDPERFWSRLRELQGEALFVWGREDRIVPIGFARHVRDALPAARAPRARLRPRAPARGAARDPRRRARASSRGRRCSRRGERRRRGRGPERTSTALGGEGGRVSAIRAADFASTGSS